MLYQTIKRRGMPTSDAINLIALRLGQDYECLAISDGSGLSRTNLVSPGNLVHLLRQMTASEYFSVFYDSLPIAGVDGTLRNRMKGTTAANNCRAKTGTLTFVCSLSGYVTTKDGEKLVFSILMNHHLNSSVARAARTR
jgi:PBP4 family serine-type D-alanyl-D-alanine carboxypeptidase